MKFSGVKTVFLFAVLSCAGAPQFSDVSEREWFLIEIKTEDENITFDRNRLGDEGFGDIFTLNFDSERISGRGAPNRYTAPYELGSEEERGLSIKNIAGTLMAPIADPERLKEREYFAYLEKAYRWNLKNGRLELSTLRPDGRETIMVFMLK